MRTLAVVLLSCVAQVSLAADAPLRPSDFAYGMTLQERQSAALYSLELPEEVYRRVTRADLGDLRVFNAAGEVVPHVLRQPASESEPEPPQSVSLPFYPLYIESDREGGAAAVRIIPGPQGPHVDLRVHNGGPQTDKTISHYVIEVSAVRAPLQQLHLKWQERSATFIANVTVETSDDMGQWRNIGGGTLADLFYGDYHLQREALQLAGETGKYLRISWPPGEKHVRLSSVTARIAHVRQEEPLHWTAAQAAGSEVTAGRYRFVADGHYPIERLEVVLPQQNTVVKTRIASSPDEQGAHRRQHYHGVIYALQQEGQVFTSGPITINRTYDRYWDIAVDQQAGGLGSGQPQLKLGWRPQQLVFLARGNGPFTLAFGSVSVGALPVDSSLHGMLSSLGSGGEHASMVRPAVAQEVRTLGGEARLKSPPPPLPWKKWLLWVVLLLGVAAMLLIARSLYRDMKRGTGGGGS
ncbi:MAG: DUF3999 domain-containing protein [Pseudomonadota bacterium]